MNIRDRVYGHLRAFFVYQLAVCCLYRLRYMHDHLSSTMNSQNPPKKKRRKASSSEALKSARIIFAVDEQSKAKFHAAAEAKQLELSEWIRGTLARTAKQEMQKVNIERQMTELKTRVDEASERLAIEKANYQATYQRLASQYDGDSVADDGLCE